MLSPCCLFDTVRMITASVLALSLTVGLLCEWAGKMYILKAYYYCFAFLSILSYWTKTPLTLTSGLLS